MEPASPSAFFSSEDYKRLCWYQNLFSLGLMSKPDLVIFLEQNSELWDAKRKDEKHPGLAVFKLHLVTFFGKGNGPGTWRERRC
ncbi:unnamed protein product [Nyctereutes procyonoides]|uniref:(raccoon dog) hypothetical protein n=1 Tax=Nyctereutes procyonoides TaxID=34880 RepID=A0A811YA81_NYCPR|nr:unnamed protein product [Nyctereutes procyonoides]